jgi:hypothetical protein
VFGFLFLVSAAGGLFRCHRASPVLAWLPVAALLLFFASAAGVPGIARIPGLLQRGVFAAILVGLLALPGSVPRPLSSSV